MKLPSLLIVTDRGHLTAYQPTEQGSLNELESHSFREGNAKVSEMVTDQAGAFPISGTPGTGSFESMPLLAELEVRCFRKIVEVIATIIDREGIQRWGLAAPSEIHGAIVDFLDPAHRESLAVQLKLNLTNSSPQDIRRRFEVELAN
ncbi:MAG: host attachment protein [Luteolibacter sp.]